MKLLAISLNDFLYLAQHTTRINSHTHSDCLYWLQALCMAGPRSSSANLKQLPGAIWGAEIPPRVAPDRVLWSAHGPRLTRPSSSSLGALASPHPRWHPLPAHRQGQGALGWVFLTAAGCQAQHTCRWTLQLVCVASGPMPAPCWLPDVGQRSSYLLGACKSSTWSDRFMRYARSDLTSFQPKTLRTSTLVN